MVEVFRPGQGSRSVDKKSKLDCGGILGVWESMGRGADGCGGGCGRRSGGLGMRLEPGPGTELGSESRGMQRPALRDTYLLPFPVFPCRNFPRTLHSTVLPADAPFPKDAPNVSTKIVSP